MLKNILPWKLCLEEFDYIKRKAPKRGGWGLLLTNYKEIKYRKRK